MNEESPEKIAAVYKGMPHDYVIDIIGAKPTEQQEEVLLAMQEGSRFISISSGHGVGKTGLLAWVIQWFVATRPNCKVPVTAPTSSQLLQTLWPEIKIWQEKGALRNWFEWTNTKFAMKGKVETWFAVARSSNKPDNLQGFHAEELMFVIDEASGVPEDIMQAVEGALTSAKPLCIMAGNPTQLSGTHFNSHHKDKKLWKTFVFSSEDSPLVSKSYCERIAAKFGKDSDVYRIRVLGIWPRGAVDTIFGIDEVMAAMKREIPEPSIEEVTIGVDVARFGDDRTVIAARRGLKIEILDKFRKMDTMETTGNVVRHIKDFEAKGWTVRVNVDDTGVGGGVTDRLNELALEEKFKASIHPVNNGSKSFDPEHYANRGTEMWYLLKDGIKDWSLPNDEDLEGELISRKKKGTSSGAIILESKKDIKKRGLESPDTADAVVLTMEYQDNVTFLEGGEGTVF